MGVQCQILINKAVEGVHRPGNPVTGKVKYCVDEPTEYQDVTLSFLGKGRCQWKKKSKKKRNRSYLGTEAYVTYHINLCNKKPEEETITLEGDYEHPFEFYLPEDIPRSYKDWIGSITYQILLVFQKPSFFSFNKVFTAEIPVYSYIVPPSNEGPVIFGLEKTLFEFFSSEKPTVNLKAEIHKTVLTPGENAHLAYVVTNNSDVDVTSVKTYLHCYTTYTANCGATRVSEETVASCEAETPEILARKVGSFSSILPTLPELYSIQQSKVISKEYRVRAVLVLPLPHFNSMVEVPIVIGERKGSIEPVSEEAVSDEQPPSYWEAMSEKTEKEKVQK